VHCYVDAQLYDELSAQHLGNMLLCCWLVFGNDHMLSARLPACMLSCLQADEADVRGPAGAE
jgi:hypothetical protein